MTTEAPANSGLPAIHPQAARLFAGRLASSIAAKASRSCRRNAGLVFISLITSVLVAEFGAGSGVAAYRNLRRILERVASGGNPPVISTTESAVRGRVRSATPNRSAPY